MSISPWIPPGPFNLGIALYTKFFPPRPPRMYLASPVFLLLNHAKICFPNPKDVLGRSHLSSHRCLLAQARTLLSYCNDLFFSDWNTLGTVFYRFLAPFPAVFAGYQDSPPALCIFSGHVIPVAVPRFPAWCPKTREPPSFGIFYN